MLAALVLAGVPPLPAYHHVAPDEAAAWPWVVGELVVFVAIMAPPFKTYVGTRALLVAVMACAVSAPSCLAGLGHPRTAYPREVDPHMSWTLAAFAWSAVVAVVAGITWLHRRRRDRAKT